MKELELKIVELIDSDRMDGNKNILIKMVSLYEDGVYKRHVKLNKELADFLKGKRIKL